MALNLPKRNVAPPPDPDAGTTESAAPVARKSAISRPSNGTSKLSTGFTQASSPTVHRLIVNAEGEEKSGKNHLGFSAPGPIYEHSFDIGNEGVIQKFQSKKKIMLAEYELEIQPGEAEAREVAAAADRVWQQYMSNYRDGLASCGNGTTLVDTGTEVWELLRLARFGKLTQVMPHHYGPVNKEMQEMVREGFGHNCNVIFLHKKKDEWENYVGADGKEKGKKTGRKTRVGFSDIPFLVQVNALCERVDQEGGGSEFQITVEDCRQNPNLNGAVLPNDFETLLTMVFED
jgi:hypothetical protein